MYLLARMDIQVLLIRSTSFSLESCLIFVRNVQTVVYNIIDACTITSIKKDLVMLAVLRVPVELPVGFIFALLGIMSIGRDV